MKKLSRFVCVILIISIFLAIPAYAQSGAEPRASAFFAAYGTDLYKASSTSFEIWFDVDANAGPAMDELGVSEIIVYRSADQQTWTKMKTYVPDNYPAMLDYDTCSYAGCVTYYNATPGYYYRAYVTFYAKNSSGIGERYVYTEILKM